MYGRLWVILAHDNSMCWHTQAWEFMQACGTLTMSWGFSFSSRGVFPGSAVMDSALSIVIVMMLAVTSCGWHDSSAVRVESICMMQRTCQVYEVVDCCYATHEYYCLRNGTCCRDACQVW